MPISYLTGSKTCHLLFLLTISIKVRSKKKTALVPKSLAILSTFSMLIWGSEMRYLL